MTSAAAREGIEPLGSVGEPMAPFFANSAVYHRGQQLLSLPRTEGFESLAHECDETVTS